MAHWAEINDNNIVTRVVVMNNDEHDDEGQQWLLDNLGGTWIKTSYNTFGNTHKLGGTPLHKNYAGVGFIWDGIGFKQEQPHPTWVLDEETYLWRPPVEYPNDGLFYYWEEETQEWKEIITE
jgi:hypothetical protein